MVQLIRDLNCVFRVTACVVVWLTSFVNLCPAVSVVPTGVGVVEEGFSEAQRVSSGSKSIVAIPDLSVVSATSASLMTCFDSGSMIASTFFFLGCGGGCCGGACWMYCGCDIGGGIWCIWRKGCCGACTGT